MAPKRGGKGGRPRKHATAEEAQATKQVQDRQRRQQQRQRQAQANNPTNGDEELQVGIAEAPSALIGALLGASPSPAGPPAPEGRVSPQSPCLQEPEPEPEPKPVPDSYPTGEPNDGPQLGGIGGDIGEGEGGWGGHSGDDIYEVSDTEQEAQRPAGRAGRQRNRPIG
jgi:hypothetical protein